MKYLEMQHPPKYGCSSHLRHAQSSRSPYLTGIREGLSPPNSNIHADAIITESTITSTSSLALRAINRTHLHELCRMRRNCHDIEAGVLAFAFLLPQILHPALSREAKFIK